MSHVLYYRLNEDDSHMGSAYWDDIDRCLVGEGVSDLMVGGSTDLFVVTDRFKDLCVDLTGVEFEPIGRHGKRPAVDLHKMVITGHIEFDYSSRATASDYEPLVTDYLPPELGEVWTFRDYQPAPQGVETPDFFQNGSTNLVWLTHRAARQLMEAGLSNVAITPASDFKPPFFGDELADILG